MNLTNPCVTRMISLPAEEARKRITLVGLVVRTLFLLALVVAAGIFAELVGNGIVFENWTEGGLLFGTDFVVPFLISGFFAAFVFLLGVWLPRTAVVTAPLFSAFLGLMAGFFSMIFHEIYSLIVFSALFSAASTVAATIILHAYVGFRSKGKAPRITACALSGLVVGQVVFFVLALVMPEGLESFSGKYWLQLLLSLVSVTAAAVAASETADELIGRTVGILPKRLSWLGAMGTVFSLVLMHAEFLRLFSFAVGKSE